MFLSLRVRGIKNDLGLHLVTTTIRIMPVVGLQKRHAQPWVNGDRGVVQVPYIHDAPIRLVFIAWVCSSPALVVGSMTL
jgi:hypothetical protein